MTTTPIITLRDGHAWTTSLDVAEKFGKLHRHVLRDLRHILETAPAEFCKSNFGPTSIEIPMPKGGTRTEPVYRMTKDGFALLAMGFTGTAAMAWKIKYITAFNRQETLLKAMLVVGNGQAVATLFKDHPRWPVIRQMVVAGEPVKAIMKAANLKSPSSVHNNIRQLVRFGLLERQWKGHPYSKPHAPYYYRLPIQTQQPQLHLGATP